MVQDPTRGDEVMAMRMQDEEFAVKDEDAKPEGLVISQPDMPDSDDSFWNPLIKTEQVEPEDVMPGEATSSVCPPEYMRYTVPAYGPSMDDDCLVDQEPGGSKSETGRTSGGGGGQKKKKVPPASA